MKKLAVYLRTSEILRPDEDCDTIQWQREKGIKFAEKNGFDFEVFEDYRPGYSVDREVFQNLLERIASREIDGVWLASLSRFPREASLVDGALGIMRKAHCRLWIDGEEYDLDDSAIRLGLSIRLALANPEQG